MGGDQLSGVMDIVTRRSAAKRGAALTEAQASANAEAFRAMAEQTASPYYTSSRCIDDGIIDPRDTRAVLGVCLEVVHQGQEVVGGNTFGISRL
jgi:acetyl-CoA carboxylase carboxyltransferase component